MPTDARGVPVSTGDAATLDRYEIALRQFQGYVGDPVATLDAALAHAPDFVLGHVVRSTLLLTMTERRFAEQARDGVAAAEALAARANERERGLTVAVRRLLDGDWDG